MRLVVTQTSRQFDDSFKQRKQLNPSSLTTLQGGGEVK